MFRSDQGYWPLLSLNDGRPRCALCGGDCPDPYHTGLECPALEATRHTVRTVVASFLSGSHSLVQPVSTLEEVVGDWIRQAFHLPELVVLPLFGAVRPLAPSLLIGVPFGGYGPVPSCAGALGRPPAFSHPPSLGEALSGTLVALPPVGGSFSQCRRGLVWSLPCGFRCKFVVYTLSIFTLS
jgi:hypothetical protein